MKQQLEELKTKLAENPKDADSLRQIGWLYLNNYYFKKAQEEYSLAANFNPRLISEIQIDHERLISQEPENIEARMSLISFLLNVEDINAAMLELEELLEIDTMNIKAYNLLGRIYIFQNKIDAAVSLLEKALEFGIKEIGISQMLASVYLEKGRLGDAIRFYEELLAHTPADKNTLRTLAELHIRTDNFDLAAQRLGQLFKSDPESGGEVLRKLEALLMNNETNTVVREVLSEVYMKSLKPDRSAQTLKEILLLDRSKIDFVIEKTKVILKNYPHHPQALLTLASIQVEKNNFSEAIENLKDLIKNHPDFKDQAISGCREIIGKYPDQYLAHQFLAESLLSSREFSKAIPELKKILSLHEESSDWALLKCKNIIKQEPLLHEITGQAYLEKDNTDKATAEAEALLAHNKDYAPGHILMGKIYMKKNLTRKARGSFQNAIRLAPFDKQIHQICREAEIKELGLEEESLKKRMSDDEWKTSLHLDLAKVYIKMDRRNDAIKELQLASRDQQKAAYVHNAMAELYIEEGRFNMAQSVLKKIFDDPNTEKQTRFKIALCYEAQGNIKKAIKTLEEILSSDLEYPGLEEKIKSLKNASLNCLQKKMLSIVLFNPETKKTYALWGRESKGAGKKQNITASFGQSHNNAGFDYYIKGMLKAALEEFDLASKIDPAFTAAVNNLGVTYIAHDRINEAVQKFKEALRIDPASSILLNNLGAAYFLEGDYPQAEKYLALACKNNPELAASAINLADVAYRQGSVQKAIVSYQSVKKQDILYSLAQKRLSCKTA